MKQAVIETVAGTLRIDPEARGAWWRPLRSKSEPRLVRLSPRALEVLAQLAAEPGAVVPSPTGELRWPVEQLRRRLSPKLVESVYGQGFALAVKGRTK